MAKEKCWKCKKMKTGVKFHACDDRLCEECDEKNEAALRALQVSDNTDKASVTIPSDDAGRQNILKPVGADAARHSRQISHSSSERGVITLWSLLRLC